MNFQQQAVFIDTVKLPSSSGILIFCTSLNSSVEVQKIAPILDALPGVKTWSVDMEDCDRVLRIVAPGLGVSLVTDRLLQKGIWIREMED